MSDSGRPLTGKVALVTGGAIRVGRAIASKLAENGATVAVHYRSHPEQADELVGEIIAGGGAAASFPGDLTDPAVLDRLPTSVAQQFGSIDLLVNSAASMMRTPFGSITPDQWDGIFALNLRAPFFLAQAVARLMGDRGGVIINIADLAAFETWPAYVPHGISKSGVVQMTRALARLLAPRIRVNAIAPGAVLLPENWSSEDADRLIKTTPLGRLGSPDDVAAAVLYLSTAEYVTGETLIVDGGRHVRA
jgi:pteridine reductase